VLAAKAHTLFAPDLVVTAAVDALSLVGEDEQLSLLGIVERADFDDRRSCTLD
jgi:hypothetical protein